MANKNLSVIDLAADDAADRIQEAIVETAQFYAGEPELLLAFNRDMYNDLTPASLFLLELEFGKAEVAAWREHMARTSKEKVV